MYYITFDYLREVLQLYSDRVTLLRAGRRMAQVNFGRSKYVGTFHVARVDPPLLGGTSISAIRSVRKKRHIHSSCTGARTHNSVAAGGSKLTGQMLVIRLIGT